MKKLVLFILLLFIPFFSYAEECNPTDISISDISLLEKSENVTEVNDASIEGNNINVNLKMKNIDDNAKYKLKITNNSNENYEINKNSIQNNSEYITYELQTTDNSNIVQPKEVKDVVLVVKYANAISDEVFNDENYSESKTIIIDLSSRSGNNQGDIVNPGVIDNPVDIDNPETGNSIVFILFMYIIGFGLVFLIINKSKYTKYFAILLLISIPFGIKAVCNTSINIVSNIEIEKPVTIDPSLGNYYNMNTGVYYQKLNQVFSDDISNQTIRVLNNTFEVTIARLSNEKTGVKLDLNGKKIEIRYDGVIIQGVLDIYNSSTTEGVIEGTGYLLIDNYGTLGLNRENDQNKIYINCKAPYDSMTIIRNSENANLIINKNVKIEYSKENNGDFARYGITNSGTVNYDGGEIVANSYRTDGISNGGLLNIKSGTITAASDGIRNVLNGVVNLSGGTINASTAIHNTKGDLNMSGGDLTGKVYGINNEKNMTITGGTITGKYNAIILYGNSSTTIGVDDSNVSTTVPLIQSTATSNQYGIFMYGNIISEIKFYDGVIKASSGEGYAINKTITNIPTGYIWHSEVLDGVENQYLVLE